MIPNIKVSKSPTEKTDIPSKITHKALRKVILSNTLPKNRRNHNQFDTISKEKYKSILDFARHK